MNAELIVCEAFYGQVTVSMTVSGNSVRAVCQVLVSVTRTVSDNKVVTISVVYKVWNLTKTCEYYLGFYSRRYPRQNCKFFFVESYNAPFILNCTSRGMISWIRDIIFSYFRSVVVRDSVIYCATQCLV